MKIRLAKLALLLILVITTGCSGFLADGGATTTGPTAQETTGEGTELAASQPAATATPAGPPVLRIWVPAEFDPQDGSAAGVLLQNALDEFIALHPGLQIDVRVKALEGSGGMLDSLTAASMAAPDIMPDLVALSRPALEAAALKGLLRPYDGLSAVMDDPDWYPFAVQLARIQNTTYGIPFAADMQVLLYRSETLDSPSNDILALLETGHPLALPAFDPQSLFALSLYLSAGGAVQDDQGRPTLDANLLTEVLQVYQALDLRGATQSELLDLDSDEKALQEFAENRTPQTILWGSRYFQSEDELPADTAVAKVPLFNGESASLAIGWMWGLSNVKPENQDLAVELAETISSPEFLGNWTHAAGLFPPRSAALAGWDSSPQKDVLPTLLPAARVIPSSSVLNIVAPSINQAVIQVLIGTKSPQDAAQEAASKVK